jgi:lipopolysaccharide/colanic/teichoic acid biosynthesis glycosyltransferase
MHKTNLWTQIIDQSVVQQSLQVIYIGVEQNNMADHLVEKGYQIFSFNLSLSADLWMKYNALSNSQLPDAIICEWELNDTTALELFHSIRNNERLKLVPFIVVAKNYNSIDKLSAFKAGIDDYYSFDVSADDLDDRIRMLKEIKQEKLKKLPEENEHLDYKIELHKRIFDVVVATLILILLSPIALIVAFLIRLESKGPIIYISKRVGRGYEIFDFYKFRSMKHGADHYLDKLVGKNIYENPNNIGNTPSFIKINKDPRITRLGWFLRITSLDEIPQLVNVIIGNMSLVGNRPLPLYEAERLTTDLWAKRFLAPAGITGLWQVSKRKMKFMNEDERKELDVAYADRASFWFDLKILILTIPALFQKDEI